MMVRFLLRALGMGSAVMALLWAAGAADMTGLATYVVVTWWSISGAFGALALAALGLLAWLRPRPGRVR